LQTFGSQGFAAEYFDEWAALVISQIVIHKHACLSHAYK